MVLVFAIQVAFLIATGLYGLNRMNAMHANLVEIAHVNQQEASAASEMQVKLAARMIALRNVVLRSRSGDVAAAIRQLDDATDSYSARQSDLRRLLLQSASSSEDERAALRRISDTDASATATIEDIVKAARNREVDAGIELIATRLAPIQARWDAELEAMIQIQATQNLVMIEESEASATKAKWVMVVLAALALLGNTLLALKIKFGAAAPDDARDTTMEEDLLNDFDDRVVTLHTSDAGFNRTQYR